MHFLSNTRLYYIEIQHLSVFQKALNTQFTSSKSINITRFLILFNLYLMHLLNFIRVSFIELTLIKIENYNLRRIIIIFIANNAENINE